MSAGQLDLVIEQGADFNPVITLQNDDDTPINLLGYVVRMQVRAEFSSPTPLLTLSSLTGQLVVDPEVGKVAFELSAAATGALTPDVTQLVRPVDGRNVVPFGVYDLHMISASGQVTALLAGKVYIAPAVTKD
jgi:hypothetical protein